MSTGAISGALKRMSYRGIITGHGFRGVASTVVHELGYEDAHIGVQLAHMKRSKNKTAAAISILPSSSLLVRQHRHALLLSTFGSAG